ncbi:hypothetical protein ACS127_01160 [Amphibacillus sp. Q70]|uniref:hypothetical protein n=1 Tax=Amphibacillus sp. Q70 TaxID=3453416 RepID=UPI003F82B375
MFAVEQFLYHYLNKPLESLLLSECISKDEYIQWIHEKSTIRELPLKVFTMLCLQTQMSYEQVIKALVQFELHGE